MKAISILALKEVRDGLRNRADKMTVLRQVADLGDAVVDVDIRPPRLDEIYAHFIAPGRLP